MECSAKGICNATSGKCECFDGYTGIACQRSMLYFFSLLFPLIPIVGVCPNDCNGRGFCQTMRDLSLYRGIGEEYTNWDGLSINICECDYGFFGYDCSLVMCPKSDDPLTVNSNYKTIQLQVRGPKDFSGKLGIVFEGETTYIPLSVASNEVCETQFENSKKFTDVSCTYSLTTSGHYDTRTFIISIHSWPISPQENNIYTHNGNPSMNEFRCDITSLTSSLVTCTFTDLISTDIPGR